METTRNRWLVVCDDERRSFPARRAARDFARWLRGHPANADIRLFGPYENVDGEPRIVDRGRPGPKYL